MVQMVSAESRKTIKEESVFIPLHNNDRLHLKRFCGSITGPVVFMLHGTVENGRIFYSRNGKGLAPFLASKGYDVFVADLRGRGESTPAISRDSSYGLSESIREEIPAFLNEIKKLRGNARQHWVAHSWGGILMLCYFARQPLIPNISSLISFGSKRRITIGGVRKFLTVNILYNFVFKLLIAMSGFVDLKKLGSRKENETKKSRQQTFDWVTKKEWKDEDGFDYASALRNVNVPPSLFIAGAGDKVLGNPKDVKVLMEEISGSSARFYLASRSNGNMHDYDHVSMLTHPDAPRDHFQVVLQWLKENDSQ